MNPREGLLNMKVSGTTKNLCLVLSHMRKQQGIPQKEVAKALGTTQGLISRYENGNSLPDLDLLSRWLDYFEIEAENKHELLEEYSRKKFEMEAKTDSQKSGFVTIPEFNVAASAGFGEFVGFEEVLEYHDLPSKFLPEFDNINAGILRINGDSMYPTINSGDHVVVHLEPKFFEDGIYLIRIDEAICKRLHKKFASIQIISDNPIYDVITVEKDDADSFQILGKVLTLKKH